MNRIAWAVGGKCSTSGGVGSYYGKCTNANSVSIELCDCTNDAGWEQMLVARKLVQYIQKKCPNAKTIIRHWDVNGKDCPAPMIGKDNIRSSKGVKANNKIGSKKAGDIICFASEGIGNGAVE